MSCGFCAFVVGLAIFHMFTHVCLTAFAYMQTIQRLGLWNLNVMQLHYLMVGMKPSLLLAMGQWEGAAENKFDTYWRENMMVLVPAELLDLLMPFYKGFKQSIAEMAASNKRVPTSARNLELLFPYLASVVVQDALELAEDFPANPVHAMLLENSTFR